jgi:hypothetical protein
MSGSITSIKKVILAFLIVAGVGMPGCIPPGIYRERTVTVRPVPPSEEYDIPELNMDGEWLTVSPFGWVWRPYIAVGWEPFTYGHWAFTDEGWVWVSYEPFGWVVYHYGSWYLSPQAGWVWVPGHGAWSPARVQWMRYGEYVCWTPVSPRGISVPRPWEQGGSRIWTVVRPEDFTRDNVGERRIERPETRSGDQRDRVVQRAPDPKDIEKRTQQQVGSVKVNREPIAVGKGQFHKMQVPESEAKRIEKYRSKVEKEVLKRPNQGEHR